MPQPLIPEPLIYDDDYIRGILRRTRTIALVGASPNWNRPSYFVMKYLQRKNFRVIPVNPGAVGQEILGEPVVASLADIKEPVDLVDIFRNSEAAGAITDEAIAIGAKAVWMQIGVRNDAAAARAKAAGLDVVMDRCPKIEYSRLCGELSWLGMNSGVVSAKRRRI
jgi:predicted CoA-binding protein